MWIWWCSRRSTNTLPFSQLSHGYWKHVKFSLNWPYLKHHWFHLRAKWFFFVFTRFSTKGVPATGNPGCGNNKQYWACCHSDVLSRPRGVWYVAWCVDSGQVTRCIQTPHWYMSSNYGDVWRVLIVYIIPRCIIFACGYIHMIGKYLGDNWWIPVDPNGARVSPFINTQYWHNALHFLHILAQLSAEQLYLCNGNEWHSRDFSCVQIKGKRFFKFAIFLWSFSLVLWPFSLSLGLNEPLHVFQMSCIVYDSLSAFP